MNQSVSAGHDFNKCAEIHDLADGTHVQLAFFSLIGQTADHLDRQVTGFLVGAGDIDATGVIDINSNAGCFSDVADVLAAGADDVANTISLDVDRSNTRCKRRHLSAWGSKGF